MLYNCFAMLYPSDWHRANGAVTECAEGEGTKPPVLRHWEQMDVLDGARDG